VADAIVIGSGVAGSVAAWELAQAGWSVTVLERGRNLRPGLGEGPSAALKTLYGGDEIKSQRHFGFPDPILEPYTTRTQADAASGVARSAVGALGQLGAAVGGTSLHYNAKFPRFWKQDFTQLTDLGPVAGAQVADWPFAYDEFIPYYDEIEYKVGVQGDINQMPARTLEQAPRSRQFVMPPNPTPYAGQVLAEGARRAGFSPYAFPAAVNSQTFDGRPACNSCGLCSGFGCPINARGDALVSFLNPAMLTGKVRVIERAWVYRIDTSADGRRATAVRWRDFRGQEHALTADLIVVAASPINTARLLLMSASSAHPQGLGNGSGQVGRNMMFHNPTIGASVFAQDIHATRGQTTTMVVDDLLGPFTGPQVSALGVPYIKGAIIQLGSGGPPVTYSGIVTGITGPGLAHKQALRQGPGHRLAAGSAMFGEDLPQAENRVDLDPEIRDFQGMPAARITYSPHRHEQAAAILLGPQIELIHTLSPGVVASFILPSPLTGSGPPSTAHLAGTARMGMDPAQSVCDASGRMHEVDNVYVADASTFPTFPGFNPSLTIMANSLRISRGITGRESP
jgi:choline dehydrogenase-like flavoprotein